MCDLTVILSIVLSLFFIFYLLRLSIRPQNFPPGPRWLPLIGNSSYIKRLSVLHHGFHRALTHLSHEYKTSILGMKLGNDLFVVVFSKELIRQVFTRNEFQARPDSYFIRLRTMGKRRGITMTDGKFWQEQRNFAVRHLRSLGFGKSHMESLIIEELQDFINILETGGDTSFCSQLAPCVLNVLWALTAGQRFPPQDAQLTRLLDLMAARSRAFDMAGGVLGQFPFIARLAPDWSGYSLITSLNKELKSLLDTIIEEHKQSMDKTKSRDFIDSFLKEMEISNDDPNTFTEDQLAMTCLDFFIAGSQTTSNTLNFLFINMILHQEVQEQAYNEIKQILGERRLPSSEDINGLPYVVAVLLESQRFLHVVPVAGPRRVLCDTYLGDYFIPKDTTVLLSLQSVHHDEELWEEPMRFWPERFLIKNNKNLAEDMCLFGLGKRRCLGEALAKSFIFLFFAGVVRNFHLGVLPGSDPPSLDPIPGITLSPRPFSVKLTPRDK